MPNWNAPWKSVHFEMSTLRSGSITLNLSPWKLAYIWMTTCTDWKHLSDNKGSGCETLKLRDQTIAVNFVEEEKMC